MHTDRLKHKTNSTEASLLVTGNRFGLKSVQMNHGLST